MKKIILSLLLAVTANGFAQSSFKGTLLNTEKKPVSAYCPFYEGRVGESH